MLQGSVPEGKMTQEKVEFMNREKGYRLSGTVKYPDVGGEYPASEAPRKAARPRLFLRSLPRRTLFSLRLTFQDAGKAKRSLPI